METTVSFIDPSRIGINTLPPPVHIEQIAADGQTFDDGARLAPASERPQSADRLHRPQPGGAGEGSLPLHAGGSGFGMEGGRQQARGAIFEPLARQLPLSRGCEQQQRGVERAGDVLDFSIAPAYYQTNWFRALCAVFFLALLWAATSCAFGRSHVSST